ELPLVPDGQDAHLVVRGKESIERQIPRASEGNDELTDVGANTSPDQRMTLESSDGGADCFHGARCNIRIVLSEEPKRALELGQGVARVDYPRHGMGLRAFVPAASRSSQRCTSSAA